MLNVQRTRGLRNVEEIAFTRKLMWAHMIAGAVISVLFLFHELFQWFVGAMLWYAASLGVMCGFMSQNALCRWLLALVFLLGTAFGVFFINRVYPASIPPRTPLVPPGIIPLWLGLANLIYVIAAGLMLFSPRIRTAGRTGFTLW